MKRIWAIAVNTSRESIRNQVLYSVMLFSVLLIGIAAAFGSVSLGDTVKFIKDFALFGLSLFGVTATVVLGVTMVHNELQRRTIYNLLAKPVGRGEFLLGKYLGLLFTLALLLASMGAVTLAIVALLEQRVDWALLPAIGSMLLETALLAAVAVWFSTIVVTPVLAGLFTVGVFIAGRSSTWLAHFQSEEFSPLLQAVAALLQQLLPRLDELYIADRVVAGQAVPQAFYAWSCAYVASYVTLLLLLSWSVFRRREFT